jgi:hypothetical protein
MKLKQLIRFVPGIALAIMLLSCNQGSRGIAPGSKRVISEEKMISFLVDLHLAESQSRLHAADTSKINDSVQKRLLFFELYRKHGITPEEFSNSLEYYISKMDKLDEIYNEVISRLTLMEAESKPKSPVQPVKDRQGADE